jgi:hypothetical protein
MESATFSALDMRLESAFEEKAVTALTQEKHISRFGSVLLYWFVGILWEKCALPQCRAGLNPALQSSLLAVAKCVLRNPAFPPTPQFALHRRFGLASQENSRICAP